LGELPKSGNPNGAGLPSWPEFTSMDNRVLTLDDSIYTEGVPNLTTLKVFDAAYAQVRGAAFGSR
jgi:para-nitrobenzyl esterase